MESFAVFCDNLHQDIGCDFGPIARGVVYGNCWNFGDEELQSVIADLEEAREKYDFQAVRKVSEARSHGFLLVRKGAELEDINLIIDTVQSFLSAPPRIFAELVRNIGNLSS